MAGIPFSATLESLKARHDRVKSDNRAGVRRSARKLAATLGVAVPEWAALQQKEARKRTPQQSPQRVTPWRLNKRERGPTVAVSSVLPWQLVEWRKANAPRGAVVHLGQHGVRLITLDVEQTFPTIEAAVAAVA